MYVNYYIQQKNKKIVDRSYNPGGKQSMLYGVATPPWYVKVRSIVIHVFRVRCYCKYNFHAVGVLRVQYSNITFFR